MFGGFQVGAFQTNFQQEGVPVARTGQTPAGGKTTKEKKQKKHRRKLYILPDGRHVMATLPEVMELLETAVVENQQDKAYIARQEQARRDKPREKVIKLPVQELVKLVPLQVDQNIVKVNMLEHAAWQPDKRLYEQAIAKVEEEDDVIALLLLH